MNYNEAYYLNTTPATKRDIKLIQRQIDILKKMIDEIAKNKKQAGK